MRLLEGSGALSREEAKSGSEEFVTFVVDARRRHADSGRSAESIADVMSYFLADYSFLARKNLCRILKLCCFVMRRPAHDYPEVVFSLDDCAVPSPMVSSCLRGVQSYVRNPEFKVGVFFSQHTMDCVRNAISGAREFMSASSSFDPWGRLCVSDRVEFVQRYSELFKANVDRRKEESYQRVRTANQRVRSDAADVSVFSTSSCSRVARGGSSAARGVSSRTPSKRPRVRSSKDGSSGVSSVKNTKKRSKKQSSSGSSSKRC